MNAPTTLQSLYRCTPRQTRRFMKKIITSGRVPFVKSSPGLGKSSIVKSLCKEFNLKLIDVRAGQLAPEDFNGLPHFTDNGKAEFAPFTIFPTEDDEIPKGFDGWMIFLDEFNHATKLVAAACYKLLLDRMIGDKNLHPNVVIVLAGNLMTDRAFVNPQSTALKSRVIHIQMIADLDEWVQDVAIPQKYDERIVGYLLHSGVAKLMDFDPANDTEETFCCPRTWEFMNDLISGETFHYDPATGIYEMEDWLPLYTGTITSGTAVDFVQYTKIFHNLITIDDVVKSPLTTQVPTASQEAWATLLHLTNRLDEKTFGAVCSYMDRFPMSHRVIFYRMIKQNKPELRHEPGFRKGAAELSKYLD